jgi:uncharacterized protein (DUF1697 family)
VIDSKSEYRSGHGLRETHVALLRGVNVGRAKRIAMVDLRALVEGLGYGDVRTVLNSGNVVFTTSRAADDAAGRIEKAIAVKLGITARVTVIRGEELSAAVAANPLCDVADNPSRFLVAFLNEAAHRSHLKPLLEKDWTPEALAVGKRVAYLWCPQSILESPLHDAVSRALKDGVTMRNWATMTKLQALVEKQT